jgi:hypothetical protein
LLLSPRLFALSQVERANDLVLSLALVRNSPNEWANRSRRGKGRRTTRICCALVWLRALTFSQATILEESRTPRSRLPHRLHRL